MLQVVVRKMPGPVDPPRFRFDFRPAPGVKGADFVLSGEPVELRTFLRKQLEVPELLSSRIMAEVETGRASAFELDLTLDELRQVLKAETKAREAVAVA